MPAMDWSRGLSEKGKGQLEAAARIMENTLRSGRPPAGRAELVPNSKNRLSELKVTKPGGKPPHLRMLFLRKRQTLWAAIGFTKQTNRLSAGDISAADSVTSSWLETKQGKEIYE